MAAPPHPRGLGTPRSARADHGSAFYVAVSRQALQLRISGLPRPGRSGGTVEAPAPRRDRRTTHRRNDDGSGSERERAGVSPPRLHLLQRRGWDRRLASKPLAKRTFDRVAFTTVQHSSPMEIQSLIYTWHSNLTC